jgi:hypothetical protein
LFKLHNQTCDIWSHAIGFLIYLVIAIDCFTRERKITVRTLCSFEIFPASSRLAYSLDDAFYLFFWSFRMFLVVKTCKFQVETLLKLLYFPYCKLSFPQSTRDFAFFGSSNITTLSHNIFQTGIILVVVTSSIYLDYYGFHCYPKYQTISFVRTVVLSTLLIYMVWDKEWLEHRLFGFFALFLSEGINVLW